MVSTEVDNILVSVTDDVILECGSELTWISPIALTWIASSQRTP